MGGILLSAFSDEYAEGFAEQIKGMEGFGIRYIEARFADGKNVSTLSPAEGRALKNRWDGAGIRVSAIGSPLGKIRLDDDLGAHLETAKRVFALANLLETPFVRVFSFYAPEGKDIHACESEVLEAMGGLLALARREGVTLCHENEAGIFGDTPAGCRRLLDAFGGQLRCVFDMGNFVLEGVDPYREAYPLLQKDIAYFHIKDALFRGAIVPPGKGDAEIKEILTAHKAYAEEDFFCTLEPHLQTFSGLNALATRSFDNPYKYESLSVAFADAVDKFRALSL